VAGFANVFEKVNPMKSVSSKVRATLTPWIALGAMAVVGLLIPGSAFGQKLFTTQEDFAGWTSGAPMTVAAQSSPDTDGSSTNGLGFSADPGGAGTPGSLGVTWVSGTFNYVFSGDLASNTAVRNLLTPGGSIAFDYTRPPAGTGNYFQLGVVFNYGAGPGGAHFAQLFSTEVDNGNGTFTTTIPFTAANYVDTDVTNYFQLGVVYNSNYNTNTPFAIDNVRFIGAAAPVAGDYNGDHVVNAADYTVWRDTVCSSGCTDLRANGDTTGASATAIDSLDFDFWKAHFNGGQGAGAGGLGAAGVPEPSSVALALFAAVGIAIARRRRGQS
jgi:hypothetical protein